jgi:hypothetical protein
MPKGAQARIDQTVNFIVGRAPLLYRTGIRPYLNAKLAVIINAGTRAAISGTLSSHTFAVAGNEQQRAMRRSILLLQYLKNYSALAITNFQQLALGSLQNQLDELMLGLRFSADQEYGGSGGELDRVFTNKLKANPTQFLSQRRVLIFGNNTSGVVNQYFIYKWQQNQYNINSHRGPQEAHAGAFQAVNIPAVPWDLVPGRTGGVPSFAAINGTELTGAAVVVSTQFTGCAFCIQEINGRLFAAHIMPDNGPAGGIPGSGIELARELAGVHAARPLNPIGAGAFANAPVPVGAAGPFLVYGSGYSNIPGIPNGYTHHGPGSHMTIIGFRRMGTWSIYSQENAVGGAIPNSQRIYHYP